MEDFVTYNQAVKLKELGFDWKCNHLYSIENPNNIIRTSHYHNEAIITDTILAPTLSQAQKWLREVKSVKVYIKPLFSLEEYEYWISFQFKGYGGDERYGVEEFWEYALSEGINEAIKIIKKEEQRNKRWYE